MAFLLLWVKSPDLERGPCTLSKSKGCYNSCPRTVNGKLGKCGSAVKTGKGSGARTARTAEPGAESPWRSRWIASEKWSCPETGQGTENHVSSSPKENRYSAACALGQMEGSSGRQSKNQISCAEATLRQPTTLYARRGAGSAGEMGNVGATPLPSGVVRKWLTQESPGQSGGTCPVFDGQARNASELPRIVCDQRQSQTASMGGDEEDVRTYHRPTCLQAGTNFGVVWRCLVGKSRIST